MEKSKLLVKTFDGSLLSLKIKPKCRESSVEFSVKYYDYDGDGNLKKARIVFREAVSVDFEINYFDNCIGSELLGFYEIFGEEYKRRLIEKIFVNRRESFLLHGDYDYDAEDEQDMLNWRGAVNEMLLEVEKYRLFQQQTQGGTYYILASGYDII